MGGYVSSDDHQVSLAREVGMSREGFMSRGNRGYVQRGRVYHGTRDMYPMVLTPSGGQWRIQDFLEGGAPIPKLGLFCNFFAENCMKMKEFGPPGVSLSPLRSANGGYQNMYSWQTGSTHPTGMLSRIFTEIGTIFVLLLTINYHYTLSSRYFTLTGYYLNSLLLHYLNTRNILTVVFIWPVPCP